MTVTLAEVAAGPIDEEAVLRSVESPECGAVVVFSGVVRDHDQGRSILCLDYQAHPDAQRLLAECCEEVAATGGLRIAAVHRVGSLQIGDVALYAAVAAAHRAEAFTACEQLVDRIKSRVPIWKRQHFPGGASEWVGL